METRGRKIVFDDEDFMGLIGSVRCGFGDFENRRVGLLSLVPGQTNGL